MIRNSTIKITSFYLISIGFILLNLWFVVRKDLMVIGLVPVVLLILLLAIFSFDKIVYFVVFFAPLSIPLSTLIPYIDFDMYLPTEPLLFGLLIIFGLKVLSEKSFDRRILKHPVTLAICANLIWIFLTCFTSTMPLVSFKFFLSRIWYVVVLYLISIKIFSGGKNVERYIWLYVVSLAAVVIYATYQLAGYGIWNKEAAHFVVNPFYNDHTSYGAATAIFLPFLAMFTFSRNYTLKMRLVSFLFFLIVAAGFVLSYSRAAWVSMIVAFGVFFIIKLQIRFRTLLFTFISIATFVLLFQSQILMLLQQNSQQSSSDLKTHISSISNITTDASNLERINRWSCAIRMFEDKPVFGWGPGTYMFKYAPYQLNNERTIVSRNDGTLGNAHSEYLGPLSESGLLGMLTFLAIVGMVIYTAVNTYSRLTDSRLRAIVLAALVSLTTYYIHGFMNNFLDTDKLSVPFWGFTAVIVAIDLHSRKSLEQKKSGLKSPD